MRLTKSVQLTVFFTFLALWTLAGCTQPPATTPQSLPAEVQTLLDKDQIEDLVVDYYTQLGTGGKGFGDYYVDDAILDVNHMVAQGREGIEELYKKAATDSAARQGTFRMLLTNIKITVTGDTATGDMIWTGINSEKVTAAPEFIEQGREHDKFVKRNGRWYFQYREITSDGGLTGIFAKTYKPR